MATNPRNEKLSSRERLLATLHHQEPDRVPVMFWDTIVPLRHLWRTRFERVLRLRELGVDDYLSIPGAWPYHPDVTVTVRRDDSYADYPRLVKELATPGGPLRMVIKKTPDYPWDDPPLVSDHNWSRSAEFLVKGPEDLDRLRYILYDPARGDPGAFWERAQQIKQFCAAEHVLVAGQAACPSLIAMGLVGAQNLMIHSVDNRPFVVELLRMILEWSKRRLEMALDLGVDIVQYDAGYESTAFWSPRDHGELFAPAAKEVAGLAHHAGALFHYFSYARIMSQLEVFRDLGVDALSYLDPPPLGDADLGEMKRRVGGRICQWGGVSAPHTIEQGTREDVRRAVIDAIHAAAPGGGFILATADAVLQESAYENVMALIETCHEFGRYPIS